MVIRKSEGRIRAETSGNSRHLERIADKSFMRLVGKCLHVGVLEGKSKLIRYADDFVIGFEHMADAKRVMDVLGKRLANYHLSLHPDKTRLINFRRPPIDQKGGKGLGNFDFLGFTVYWRRNRNGIGWHVASKTRKARLTRAIARVYEFCHGQRHKPIPV